MRRIDPGVRPSSRNELAAWYSAALDAQVASGLSVAAYAERIGVSVPTLYQWRRRLGSPTHGTERGPELIEVSLTGAGSRRVDGLVVRVCDGRRSIEVPRGFDGDDLRRVIEVLESC